MSSALQRPRKTPLQHHAPLQQDMQMGILRGISVRKCKHYNSLRRGAYSRTPSSKLYSVWRDFRMERRQPGRKLYIAIRARMYNRTSLFTDSLALICHPRLNNIDCWRSGSTMYITYSLTILNATQSKQLVKNVTSTPENAGAKTSIYAGDGAQFTSKLGISSLVWIRKKIAYFQLSDCWSQRHHRVSEMSKRIEPCANWIAAGVCELATQHNPSTLRSRCVLIDQIVDWLDAFYS